MTNKQVSLYFVYDGTDEGGTYVVWSRQDAEQLKEQFDAERREDGIPYYFNISGPEDPNMLAGSKVLVSRWRYDITAKEGGCWEDWEVGTILRDGEYRLSGDRLYGDVQRVIPGSVVMELFEGRPALPVSRFK
jgi:hypothetical protein